MTALMIMSAASLLVGLLAQTAAGDQTFDLGPDGEIPRWLTLKHIPIWW